MRSCWRATSRIAKGGSRGSPPTRGPHGRSTDGAKELRQASEADPAVASIDQDLYRFLRDYPDASVPDYAETFYWIHYKAHGQPSLILTHTFATSLGGARMLVQRQYYVSRGYNVEQAIGAFLPVKEGTLVVYWNHTSTDQISGMGASMKRSLGQRLMARQLEDLFKRLREVTPEQ